MLLYLAHAYFQLKEYFLCLQLCYELAKNNFISTSTCILISKCLCKCGLLIAAENWLNHAKLNDNQSESVTEAEILLNKSKSKSM